MENNSLCGKKINTSYNLTDNSERPSVKFIESEKENIEEKVLGIYENDTEEIKYIKAQLSVDLKPGKKIIIKEIGIAKETIKNNFSDEESNPSSYDIIDNTPTEKLTGSHQTVNGLTKMNEWVKMLNQQKDLLSSKLLKVEDNYNILQANHRRILNINERKAIIMKYGLVSYLIFLILSLALFFVSGTLFVIWRFRDVAIFNPGTLFYGMLIGLGWSATAFAGIFSVKKRMRQHEL